MCLTALDFKMFCEEDEYWKVQLRVSLSVALFQKFCRVFNYFFLNWQWKTKRITLEIMICLFWFCSVVSALTGRHSQHYHRLVRCVSQSARRDSFSENRISDSAPTCKKRKLCSVKTVLVLFTDQVLDVSKVYSKNEMKFPLRPHTPILRDLFFKIEALSIHQALLWMSASVQDIQM